MLPFVGLPSWADMLERGLGTVASCRSQALAGWNAEEQTHCTTRDMPQTVILRITDHFLVTRATKRSLKQLSEWHCRPKYHHQPLVECFLCLDCPHTRFACNVTMVRVGFPTLVQPRNHFFLAWREFHYSRGTNDYDNNYTQVCDLYIAIIVITIP